MPAEAFIKLAQIERHFEGRQSGPTVWRMLDQLDEAAKAIWTESLLDVLSAASALTVFTNFPIGLLKMPGDTSPLTARLPIAYRPLLPLTRALQKELDHQGPVEWAKGIRVLIAECIPSDDPVGRASRKGWDFASEHLSAPTNTNIEVVETLSVSDLRAAINDKQPDLLVISAHGALNRQANVAGVVIGRDFCLGPELGPMPPLVILSACHVAPKGAGAVSISDLLLRQGAVAVLGTQVPVDVFHNATLMMRLFVYISEVLDGREEHGTLLDVWHRVQTSNAVNDVLQGNRSLQSWASSATPSGLPVLQEFMVNRSSGRLRRAHIYADTEGLLAEIAEDQGMRNRVLNWFRNPGYVPESLFYILAGRPERIYMGSLSDITSGDRTALV
ncbi:CHAT domain-containing protein [Micromonospora sp. URMC 105]|uniref:CHAT domain-containing protein n=1 Tax=Micromonospora sp. URMC 105 TaxID=3423413 RepID=UPI003F19E8D8